MSDHVAYEDSPEYADVVLEFLGMVTGWTQQYTAFLKNHPEELAALDVREEQIRFVKGVLGLTIFPPEEQEAAGNPPAAS